MEQRKRRNGTAISMTGGITSGAAVSLGITLAGSALLAKLLDMERLTWENVGYGILLMLLTGAFSGSLTAIKLIKRRRLQVSLISGCVYWASLLVVTALFFGGQYQGVWVTAALILAGSLSAGLLGIHAKRGGKHTKRRIVHC